MRHDPIFQEADDLIAKFGDTAPAWAEYLACRFDAEGLKLNARTWRQVRDAAVGFLASARARRNNGPEIEHNGIPAHQQKRHAEWTTGDFLRLEIIGGIGAHSNKFPQRWGKEDTMERDRKIVRIAETIAQRIERDFTVERILSESERRDLQRAMERTSPT